MNQAVTKEDNIIDLNAERSARQALLTGGPVGPENWLSTVERGVVFLARPKNSKDLILNKYMLWEHKSQSTNLLWGTPDGKQIDIWVPTLEFSRQFSLHEIIGQVVLEEEQGVDNGLASETKEGAQDGRIPAPEGTGGGSTEEPA